MQGRVYRARLRGEYDDLHHPFVVVIEFSGTRDCLVVPGFDASGTKVNEAVAGFVRAGYAIEEVFVELDNARHVDFNAPYTGKLAKWLVAKNTRLPTSLLDTCECMGIMDIDGLRFIAQSLLALAQGHPARFSPATLKKLRKILSDRP